MSESQAVFFGEIIRKLLNFGLNCNLFSFLLFLKFLFLDLVGKFVVLFFIFFFFFFFIYGFIFFLTFLLRDTLLIVFEDILY